MVSRSYSLAFLTMRSVMAAISAMKRVAAQLAVLHLASLYSHSPVSSALESSSTPRPRSSVISWKALAVGISSRPSRSMYFSAIRPSMMPERVAGVPRPFSCMASRSSSSSTVLPGAFHGTKQGGLGVAGRRLGFEALGVDRVGLDLLIGLHRHQVLALVAVLGVGHFLGSFLAVDGQPARFDQHLAFGFEVVSRCCGNARGDLVFGRWEEHRHEAAHHQVVDLLFCFG